MKHAEGTVNQGKYIDRATALGRLVERITPRERAALERGGEGLVISRYNRETLLRLLSTEDLPEGEPIAAADIETMEGALQGYLDRYMPEAPEGHKWIVLSCLFLALVVREPMHPQAVVGWRREEGAYVCPAREGSEGSLCRWCVCRGEA